MWELCHPLPLQGKTTTITNKDDCRVYWRRCSKAYSPIVKSAVEPEVESAAKRIVESTIESIIIIRCTIEPTALRGFPKAHALDCLEWGRWLRH